MFAFRKRYKPEVELENLNGKVALVTGGSNGLGYWTCQWLVRRGAKVYMGARSESKARAAIEQLTKDGLGNLGGELIWHHCDVSTPMLAKECGDKFRERESKLHIVINNAAIGLKPFVLDPEIGVMDLVVVNHLSPAALDRALFPLLESTAREDPNGDVRIIYVGSSAHKGTKKLDTLIGKESLNLKFGDGFSGEMSRYGFSKLLHIIYVRQLQLHLPPSSPPNILYITADPGGGVTSGVEARFSQLPLGWLILSLMRLLALSPPEAAMTSAYAAGSKTISKGRERYKGEMIVPFGTVEKYGSLVVDERLGRELWETTEEILKECGAW